jgi:hypothetical protein
MEELDRPILTRDGHIVVIDFFRPEDAPGIAALFRDVYGEHYPIRIYYDPEALIRANAGGDCCSIVARNESDQVVGATHAVRSSPYKGIYESSAGLVLRTYRNQGINNRLQWFLFYRWAPTISGIAGIFGEPVCQHIHLQKSWHDLGAVEVGLEVALMPANAYKEKKEGQDRVSCMAAYRPVVHRPHRVYLPDVYIEALGFLYSGLNEEREFLPSLAPLSTDHRTECRIKIFDFAAIARVAFQETGADLWASVEKMEGQVRCKGVKVIQVWLKLGSPWVGAAVDVFRANGYFLGGLLPRWFDEDSLLMQKLFCSPEWEGIQLYTKRAERIFDIVRKDLNSVVSLKE